MTAQASTCPNCGKPVSGASIGLCPECLLSAGVPTAGPTGATAFVPPTPEELAGHFPQLEILELLGHGGMGAVYKARQKQLDRLVALKILPRGVSDDPAFAERFAREARALARLHHPNIVTLYEFGQADGQYFFLMEYVDGLNLRRLIEAGGLAPKEALAIVPQICDALQFAHDQRIIHRDIKPENILLTKSGQVKIADFGVAKLLSPDAPPTSTANQPSFPIEQTEAGKVVGTPSYMAPEQLTNPEEVDNRADIYALGVVFYQMLTGELPTGKFDPPSVRMRGVHIDVRLDEVVLRALEKEPALRYQQASEVKERVQTIAQTNSPHQPTPESIHFGKAIGDLLGAAFTSRLALQVANLSALGFLCFLGFVPLPGWHRLFGFSGFFGLIGVAVIIEAVARWSRPAERARLLSAWLKVAVVLLLCFLVFCFVLFKARRQEIIAQRDLAEERARLAADLKAKAVSPITVTITHVTKGDLPIHLIAIGNVEKGAPGDAEQGIPVSAKFAIPESEVQSVFKRFRSDEKAPVVAEDQSGAIVARGALSAMDNQIDPATDTLNCKASLTPENDAILLPGKFLRLELLMEIKHDATIIPTRAVVNHPRTIEGAGSLAGGADVSETPEAISEKQRYEAVVTQLTQLRAQRLDLLSRYQEGHPLVKSNQREMDELETTRRALEKKASSSAGRFVWVLRPNHTVELRPITIAAMESGRAAVASGLQPGEPIVIDPPANLSEGAKVNATP